MKKLLLIILCAFGIQSASYGFLGTALNTESEKAFLKSMEMHTGMTDEQAKELLLKAARLQERLHKWSAAGVGITALPLAACACLTTSLIHHLGWGRGDHTGDVGLVILLPIVMLALGGFGLAFGKSLSASIKAKKRAAQYKKMSEHAAHLKYYQGFTERCGYMADYFGTSTWNTIAHGRKKVMKKGLNAQMIGTALGALGFLISAGLWWKGPDRYKFVSVVAFAAFTLFSAYGLKGIVRKQAMKKLMAQMKTTFIGEHGIAQDPEAAALARIAEWEREEAAAQMRPVL